MLRTMKMLAFAAVAAGALSFGTVAASAQSTTLENAQKRGTLRIATIGSNQPFTTVNVNGEPEGYDVDIGKMIAAALKLKPEFVMTDSAGRIAALQTGKADLTIASFSRTVERSEVISFTDPYVIVGLQFLVRADRKDLNTFDDLKKPGIKFGKHHHADEAVDPATPTRPMDGVDEALLRAALAAHVPSANGRLLAAQTCLYTMAPDGDFILDRLPGAPAIIVASPCSGHGFKFAPVIGEILADLVTAGATRHDIARFRIARPSARVG